MNRKKLNYRFLTPRRPSNTNVVGCVEFTDMMMYVYVFQQIFRIIFISIENLNSK